MENDKIIAYLLENERKRYEHAKEFQKTVRWLGIMFILCITIIACSYMYFVVPVEEDTMVVTNGSQMIDSSSIGGNNGM